MLRYIVTASTVGMFACSNVEHSNVEHSQDWGPASLRLQEGMTEKEAIQAVGYTPSKAEIHTCGSQSNGGSWDCRILTFGNIAFGNIDSKLNIIEARVGANWLVSSWNVFP